VRISLEEGHLRARVEIRKPGAEDPEAAQVREQLLDLIEPKLSP
jgi:hypothetical protein